MWFTYIASCFLHSWCYTEQYNIIEVQNLGWETNDNPVNNGYKPLTNKIVNYNEKASFDTAEGRNNSHALKAVSNIMQRQ